MKIIAISYAQPLADDLARLCYDFMTTDWYKRVFPNTRLSRGRQSIDNFRTTRRGHRIATSIGGTLTGRGADIMIIDDPMKADDAFSETVRANVTRFFSNTLPSRADNKKAGSAVLLVMQRLHQDDAAAYCLSKGWPALTLPAIAPDDMTFEYSTALGPQAKFWKKGEALQSHREPLDVLHVLREEMGSISFSAQYLLDPEPAVGNIIKRAWLRRYAADGCPPFRTIVQSWDTASKTSELNDFSVCTTWGVTRDNVYYLLDVFRERLEYPDLVRAVIELKQRHNAQVVLIEDKTSGTSLAQDLLSRRVAGIRTVQPKGEKAMRLVAVSALFENGKVLLPECAPWLDEYVRELVTFPGKFDDQVDSTTQALLWLCEAGVEPSIIAFYREGSEALEREKTAKVRIRSADGVSHTLLIDGIMINPDNDAIFELTAQAAQPYLRSGWVVV